MNIPSIENSIKRRSHLIWIIPYLIICIVPCALYAGLKEILPGTAYSLVDVWNGRR